MKNFRKNIDKKVWGVLGKQQTYYSPNQFVGERVPLNANPLEAWDTKRSRYKRVDLVPKQNDGQQAGVVPEVSSSVVVVTPTPTPTITQTNTPTPSFTPTQTETNTPTPTLTPSSTPFNLPSTPDLWYDATNIGSIDYITSGGTDYVSGWRSVGTYQKYLSGTTTDTMPVWSASTLFPGSPKIIRFNKSATVGLRDFLTQRFDSTVITGAGITVFTVIAKPSILDYASQTTNTGFGIQFNLYSGNTTTGGFTPVLFTAPRLINQSIGAGSNTIQFQSANSGVSVSNSYSYSATNLNDKFLLTQAMPFPTGFPYVEINQSATTLTNAITGTPVTTFNSFTLGAIINSGGTITASNSGCELAEIMIYTRELTVQQQEAVQNYLRDKWRYDEWASPVPTPTQTASPTQTTTQTNTPTTSSTPTPTPSSTPFSPSSLNPIIWVDFNDASTMTFRAGTNFLSNIRNKGTYGGLTAFTQSTAANQPLVSASTQFTGVSVSAATIGNDFLQGIISTTGQTNITRVVVMGKNTSIPSPWDYRWGSPTNAYATYMAQTATTARKAFFDGGSSTYCRIDCSLTNRPTTGQTYLEYVSTSASTRVSYSSFNGSATTESIVAGSSCNQFYFDGAPGASTLQLLTSSTDTTVYNNEIGEILMFTGELTTTQTTNLLNYLKTKWGLKY